MHLVLTCLCLSSQVFILAMQRLSVQSQEKSLRRKSVFREGSFAILIFLSVYLPSISRLTLMVGVVVLSFLICWFPFALMFAGSPFCSSLASFFDDYGMEEPVTWLGKAGYILVTGYNYTCVAYTNSCLNPVIYAAMNTGIRKGMCKMVMRITWD